MLIQESLSNTFAWTLRTITPPNPPPHTYTRGAELWVWAATLYSVLNERTPRSREWKLYSVNVAVLLFCPPLSTCFFPVWELHMDTKKWWILSCGVFPSSTVWRFSEPTVCEIVYMGWCEMLMIWLFLLFILYLFFCITSSFPVDCFTVWEPPSPSLISGWGRDFFFERWMRQNTALTWVSCVHTVLWIVSKLSYCKTRMHKSDKFCIWCLSFTLRIFIFVYAQRSSAVF